MYPRFAAGEFWIVFQIHGLGQPIDFQREEIQPVLIAPVKPLFDDLVGQDMMPSQALDPVYVCDALVVGDLPESADFYMIGSDVSCGSSDHLLIRNVHQILGLLMHLGGIQKEFTA